MNFLFAKLFEEYIRKKEFAEIQIFGYICIFYSFLSLVILLPIRVLLKKIGFFNTPGGNSIVIILFMLFWFGLIAFGVYRFYIKNKFIHTLMKRYKKTRISKLMLYVIMTLAPLIFMVLAATLAILLNSGKIVGYEIQGIL